MTLLRDGHRNLRIRRRDLTARDIAMRNMDVKLQTEVLHQENKIFYQHLVETKNFLKEKIIETTGRDGLDGWIVCGSGLASLPKSAAIKICRISMKFQIGFP
jgi:hypothetical protein